MVTKISERCANFKLAMNIGEVPLDDFSAEFILAVFDHINLKKGDTKIRDIIKIKNKLVSRYISEEIEQQSFNKSQNNDNTNTPN